MTFPAAVRIADEGLANIYAMQEGFLSIRAILTVIQSGTPAGTTVSDLAQLGLLEADDWLTRSAEFAEVMRVDLDSLDFGGVQ